MQGWTVHVDTRLLEAPPAKAVAAPPEIFRRRLADVRLVPPADELAQANHDQMLGFEHPEVKET